MLLAVGWMPIILIVFCIFRRRKYYIKRENNHLIFVRKNKTNGIVKPERKSVELNNIIHYYIENQELYIITKENNYILDDFHVKISKVEELFISK